MIFETLKKQEQSQTVSSGDNTVLLPRSVSLLSVSPCPLEIGTSDTEE